MKYDPYNDNQGRDNPNSVNASRAALGLPPLHRDLMQDDGGETVDSAPYSCDSVMELLPSWVAWLVVACISACMAIACGLLDPLFPR